MKIIIDDFEIEIRSKNKANIFEQLTALLELPSVQNIIGKLGEIAESIAISKLPNNTPCNCADKDFMNFLVSELESDTPVDFSSETWQEILKTEQWNNLLEQSITVPEGEFTLTMVLTPECKAERIKDLYSYIQLAASPAE